MCGGNVPTNIRNWGADERNGNRSSSSRSPICACHLAPPSHLNQQQLNEIGRIDAVMAAVDAT